MRRRLGTAVFSEMIGVALFGVFLTPAFLVVLSGRRRRKQAPAKLAAAVAANQPT